MIHKRFDYQRMIILAGILLSLFLSSAVTLKSDTGTAADLARKKSIVQDPYASKSKADRSDMVSSFGLVVVK